MSYGKSKSKSKWQKNFINNVFKKKELKTQTYSNIIQKDKELLKTKLDYLPNKLCKFFAPTSDNILDIKRQRIWLSHPSNFNDPFDCHVGYDIEEYEKKKLTEYIKKQLPLKGIDSQEFTTSELQRIESSETYVHYLESLYNGTEEYWDVKRKILENKSKKIQEKISNMLREYEKDIQGKIEIIREKNIRVTCFSNLIDNDSFKKNITMWSHYADNHKGFCVEYDLCQLNKSNDFELNDYSFYEDSQREKYLQTRMQTSIKAGLFPVIYTNSRINIPFSKLNKIKFDKNGNLKYNNDIDAILYKTYLVKSSNWSYEKEWRLILDSKVSNYYDNKVPFPYIKRIYLGCKIDPQVRKIITEISKENVFEVVQLIMNDKKFTLEDDYSYSIRDYEWQKKSRNPFI